MLSPRIGGTTGPVVSAGVGSSEWGYIYIAAGSFVATATSGANVTKYEWTTNDVNMDYAAFDAGVMESIEFPITMPETWDRGEVRAKFQWTVNTTPGSGTKVEWGISALGKGDGDSMDAAFGTEVVITDTYNATENDLHVTSPTPELIIGGDPNDSDVINFKVTRNVDSADDDIDVDVWLLGVHIQYRNNIAPSSWA